MGSIGFALALFTAALQSAPSLGNPEPQSTPSPVPPAPHFNPGPAKPKDMPTWVTITDYPSKLKGGEAGVTAIQLIVGSNGRPKSCTITASSGFTELDRLACKLLKGRAHFRPAFDDEAMSVVGSWSGQVNWSPSAVSVQSANDMNTPKPH